jgi:response regulator RpfG family c-di-GMP phosphodiesterase
LSSLRSIDQAINNSLDLNLALTVLVDRAVSGLMVDAVSILRFNAVNHMLEHAAGSGYRARLVNGLSMRIGEPYAGLAMYERRRVQFPAAGLPPPSENTARLMAEEGFVCGVCAPLITKGEVKGVMQVFGRTMLRIDADWLSFLDMLASQGANAIESAELFNALQRSNQNLKQTHDSMLESWVRAMEMRDRDPVRHNRSVTRLTLELAERMRIDPDQLNAIRRGSMLHDIGKLGIPDAVLFKPGPLSEDEWDVVRRHPRMALDILAPIPSLDDATDIPYAHHERWDGSGYPRGLKGERIPLAARLFAVVDVWDSMTSEKPYHPTRSKEDALGYIREQSGKHFDPRVVDTFLEVMR